MMLRRIALPAARLALGLSALLIVSLAACGSSRAQSEDVAAGAPSVLGLVYQGAGDDPDGKDRLDIYRPKGQGPFPVMVFLHGGGLLRGDKQQYARLGERLAGEGFVAVVPNHRLSPRVSHPAHVRDVAAALAWIRARIAEHDGDPERIVLFGHSAGGYLAALLALDPRYLGEHGLDAGALRAVVPISGFFHVDRIAESRPKSVWGPEREIWLEASPARYVRADLPPMLLLYADGDTPERRRESEDLRAELAAAGHRAVEAVEIADRDHVSIIQRFGSPGDATVERLLAFARAALEGE